MGWKGLKNGALLDAAQGSGFEVLLTADNTMYREHDLSGRSFAVVCMPTTRRKRLEAMSDAIARALENIRPGRYFVVADAVDE